MRKWKIKRGDLVEVISGSHKGARGQILSINRSKERVFVGGVNLRSCRLRPSAEHPEGGVVEKEVGIHVSNIMLVDPSFKDDSEKRWSLKSLTRVGLRIDENGRKIRYAKRSGVAIGGM
jgi:large subunit ribosomal protein L24